MKQGIIICAYGKRGYGFGAYHLAYSIKHYCKDYPIYLYCEERTISQLFPEDLKIFDKIIIFNDRDYKRNGIPDVATMKVQVLKNSPFDETLYLDADCVCVSDIKEVMEKFTKGESYFYIDVQGKGNKGDEIVYDAWSKHDVAYPFFGLDDEDVFYSTNSSWFYFKNGLELSELYGWMLHYLNKSYPMTELKNKWIKGMLPDELLWSGVISKLKINCDGFKLMYYGNTYESIVDVRERHPFITYYGRVSSGVNLVKPIWLEFMAKHVKAIHKIDGVPFKYNLEYSYYDKALNNNQ